MQVSSASLQMSLGAFVAPDKSTLGTLATGQVHVGATIAAALATATKVLAARLNIGAASTTGQVALVAASGAVTPGTAGARQIETATVVAAAGCTASGNLALTLTGANITGSPLAISVPLTTTAHTSAAAIATAIAAALNATAAFAAGYTAIGASQNVMITARYPRANDTTLNLAIAAGLGVTAAASSANTLAGTAGAIVDLPASATTDMFGTAGPAVTTAAAILVRVTGPGTVSAISGSGLSVMPPVKAGTGLLWYADAGSLQMTFQADGPTIADILIIGA